MFSLKYGFEAALYEAAKDYREAIDSIDTGLSSSSQRELASRYALKAKLGYKHYEISRQVVDAIRTMGNDPVQIGNPNHIELVRLAWDAYSTHYGIPT